MLLFKNDGLNFRLLFEKVLIRIPLFTFIALFDDDKEEGKQQHIKGDDGDDDDNDNDGVVVVVVVDIIIVVIVFSLLLLFFKMYAGGSLWFKLQLHPTQQKIF